MAESLVQVTEGSGKKLHTYSRVIGANTVEDEAVLLAEQYAASYVISAGASLATGGSHLLQIMAGASLPVRIRRIELWQGALATVAALVQMQIFRLTSAGTGGAVQTPQRLDNADAAAGLTAMTLPGVKGTEAATALAYASFVAIQTIGASTSDPEPKVVWDFDRPRSKSLIIPPGVTNGLAIKLVGACAGAALQVQVWADELAVP